MKIWFAHLSGRQRSSQISGKEVERIGALALYSDSLAVMLQSPALSFYLQTSRGNDSRVQGKWKITIVFR